MSSSISPRRRVQMRICVGDQVVNEETAVDLSLLPSTKHLEGNAGACEDLVHELKVLQHVTNKALTELIPSIADRDEEPDELVNEPDEEDVPSADEMDVDDEDGESSPPRPAVTEPDNKRLKV
mmetsp:Transcript_46816/g.117983  ORF Transcript_46816/g.117983 Transcript_46816/m.117983 type:complete len:123 (-) Transcript_46816:287-655(-)|eukprot:CAMPEP_0177680738 /NCGR_PEP_ID=MMETSP0447-20121125/30335_1 /TAXON_ID=0 /ORGANISM="Stygamoeba regulata, Strain BSH-02190019" /LENGTH=122 /DNA_ID=CAMNT_0019190093 /DNA_START=59 /DNA_END=427 /DNA_ORIENTATION=-